MRLTSDKKFDHRARDVTLQRGSTLQLQLTLAGTAPTPVEKRKSYTREEKLKVLSTLTMERIYT